MTPFLHENNEDYIAHLQHKPSVNTKLPYIKNEKLVDLMNSRSWGVSEQAQLSKGTFVEAFECLVSVQNENFSLTKNKISSNQLLSKFFGKTLLSRNFCPIFRFVQELQKVLK